MKRFLFFIFTVFLVFQRPAAAADSPQAHHAMAKDPLPCGEPVLACASVAAPYFTKDGTLYLAFAAGGKVLVALSSDYGRHLTPPVAVTPEPARIDAGADSRPSIVVDARDRIILAWSVLKDRSYNAEAFFSRSTDGGSSFSPPRPLTGDPASQRFPTLVLDRSGAVFAVWTDKRLAAAHGDAALAYAWSEDAGASFGPTRIVQSNVCECCRLAAALAGPGRPAVTWRNIFGGTTRDHALMTFPDPAADPATPGPIRRVAEDEWRIDACPHHGPDLSVAADGSYHVAWFTEGSARQGLQYAHSSDGGQSFSAPRSIGNPERQAGRPSLLAAAGRIWLAWKEFDGKESTALVMVSGDGGTTWSEPRTVGHTAEASDRPLLAAGGGHVFLSWLTRAEGYRLLPVEDKP